MSFFFNAHNRLLSQNTICKVLFTHIVIYRTAHVYLTWLAHIYLTFTFSVSRGKKKNHLVNVIYVFWSWCMNWNNLIKNNDSMHSLVL